MKILKWLLIALLILALVAAVAIFAFSEKKPSLTQEGADVVADKMLENLNYDQWDDVKYLTWKFPGGHHYQWDKMNNNVIVSWGDNKVYLNLDEVKGNVYKEGKPVDDASAVQSAWSRWCNDSFWMFAPFKIYDKGVTRALSNPEDAAHGLMVTYKSGGVTPGDAYLWLLDEDYRPKGYKMWVSILPVKGIYSTWENWQQLSTGTWVSTKHKTSKIEMNMTDVKDGNSWADIGVSENPDSLFP